MIQHPLFGLRNTKIRVSNIVLSNALPYLTDTLSPQNSKPTLVCVIFVYLLIVDPILVVAVQRVALLGGFVQGGQFLVQSLH
jgi:hypothetical protein